MTDDKQVERDNFQGYDDTCFERGVTEAMELMGWIAVGAAQQTAYDLYARLYPGADRNLQGTYMSDALRGVKLATGVDGEWRYGEADVMAALDAGKFCLLGERDLMHIGERHFLLFLPGRGDSPQGIHCIDSDEALDANPDVWPLATVVAAGQKLMGAGQPIGISFKLEDRNVADTPTPPVDPTPATLQAQNGLNAQGEYDLAQAFVKLMAGDRAGATALLFDGPESTFGQLEAIDPVRFPVPTRPNF